MAWELRLISASAPELDPPHPALGRLLSPGDCPGLTKNGVVQVPGYARGSLVHRHLPTAPSCAFPCLAPLSLQENHSSKAVPFFCDFVLIYLTHVHFYCLRTLLLLEHCSSEAPVSEMLPLNPSLATGRELLEEDIGLVDSADSP